MSLHESTLQVHIISALHEFAHVHDTSVKHGFTQVHVHECEARVRTSASHECEAQVKLNVYEDIWTLVIKLQNGQSMFSHPHCIVELLGAFIEFTVKLEASPAPYNESTSMCPERNWPEIIKNYHFHEKIFRHIHKFKKKNFF